MAETRTEKLYNSIASGEKTGITPITREEQYLSYIAGESTTLPSEPITRKEMYLKKIAENGTGGGGTSGGTIPEGYIKPSGTINITENGTHDVTQYASANVNVQASGGDTLKAVLDATKSAYYLFNNYTGESVDGLISYNTTENVTDMQYMFQKCTNLTTVPLFDTSKVTSIAYMFQNCSALTEVPQFDTSNVTKMGNMFNGCSNLTTVPLFDTSKVTSIAYMFQNCTSLTTLRPIDLGKATNVNGIVQGCTALKSIKFLNIGTKIKDNYYWFKNCTSLELIDFRGATGVPTLVNTDTFTNVPSTCKVVIPDSLYDTWINATNWSAISVTWVKESEYVEE